MWDLMKSQITYFYCIKSAEQSDSCTMCRQWLQWSLNFVGVKAETSLLVIMPCCFSFSNLSLLRFTSGQNR